MLTALAMAGQVVCAGNAGVAVDCCSSDDVTRVTVTDKHPVPCLGSLSLSPLACLQVKLVFWLRIGGSMSLSPVPGATWQSSVTPALSTTTPF